MVGSKGAAKRAAEDNRTVARFPNRECGERVRNRKGTGPADDNRPVRVLRTPHRAVRPRVHSRSSQVSLSSGQVWGDGQVCKGITGSEPGDRRCQRPHPDRTWFDPHNDRRPHHPSRAVLHRRAYFRDLWLEDRREKERGTKRTADKPTHGRPTL